MRFQITNAIAWYIGLYGFIGFTMIITATCYFGDLLEDEVRVSCFTIISSFSSPIEYLFSANTPSLWGHMEFPEKKNNITIK